MYVGKKVTRVDAYDKVIGRTRYTDDLCDKSAYVARVVHSTIANGRVLSIDTSEAEKIPGVVKIFTCFDLKEKHYYPTAGHPWSTDPSHQDVADRLVLTDRVRFYGDDIAAVVAEDEVAAAQALRALKVEYEEYPFVLDVQEAMKDGAPQLHDDYPNNILKHTTIRKGNYEEAIKEPGLIKVEGWYSTPTVQHCHIENFICYAEMESDRIKIVSSTQIPHIVRRVVGQALGIDWGKIRIIKPYIGGGFGNKQDVLYEPLCAWLCMQLNGHLIKLDVPREETFVSTRVRHAIKSHIISWVRPDGTFVARKLEAFSDQGAYASHGHSICAKGVGAFPQLYPCDNVEADAYTIFTNKSVAGAMRGYGIPQAMWAVESHTEEIAAKLGIDPIEFRRKNLMPVGFTDAFSKNELYTDTFNQCIDKGMEVTDYKRKYQEYQNQTGDIRRGIGMAVFWYNTAVWPISLETSSCRMVLNQDGSLQVQLGETEIGQGADTAYSQMTADVLGVPLEAVHIVSCQDTDITPFGTGAYASRQTYTAGFSIRQTAALLKERILKYAHDVEGFGYDISKQAINVAKENAKLNDVSALFERSDLFEDVMESDMDVIVSNPPYIPSEVVTTLMPEVVDFEPHEALDGKEDGLYFYRKIIDRCKEFLKSQGYLLFEIGYDQGEAVSSMLRCAGFEEVRVIKDLARNDRVVMGHL